MSPPNAKPAPRPSLLLRLRIALDCAFQSTWCARRRIVLAVVGVSIGFGAIASMLIIGDSLEARARESLASLGGDVLAVAVQDPSDWSAPRMRLAALAAPAGGAAETEPVSAPMRQSVSRLAQAMPEVRASAWFALNTSCGPEPGANASPGYEVYLAQHGIEALLSLRLSAGRGLNVADRGQATVIAGSEAIQSLRERQPALGVGSWVAVCGRPHRIVGILHPHRGSELVRALQINRALLAAAEEGELTQPMSAPTLLVSLRGQVDSQAFGKALGQRVARLLAPHRVQVTGAGEILKARHEQVRQYSGMLAVLGGVALLVGGLGVAHMMLVSVSQRRGEIGLRVAVGARRADIAAQFLCESVLVCLTGSALGMLAGLALAAVVLMLAGFAPVLSQGVMLKASVLALAGGVLAGAYPAYRAACVQPISSLQGTADQA